MTRAIEMLTREVRAAESYARDLGDRVARLEAARPSEPASDEETDDPTDRQRIAMLQAASELYHSRLVAADLAMRHARFMAAGWRRLARHNAFRLDGADGRTEAVLVGYASAVDLVRRACRELARREPEAAAAILADLERVGGGL